MLATALIHGEYWLLLLLWIAALACAWRSAAVWRDLFRSLRPAHWGALGIVTGVAAWLRILPRHWQHNVFDDEYVHLRLAAEMASHFRFAFVVASPGAAPQLTLPPCPPGFHFVMSQVFLLTGYSESAAFLVNALCGVLCVPVAFLLARLLFESHWAAHTAAVLLAVWPLHVRLSRATSLEIVALLSLLLLGIVLAQLRRSPSLALAALALQTAAWTAVTRNELLLVIPVALAVVFTDERTRAVCASPLRLALLLPPLLVPLLHALFGVAHYNEQRQMLSGHPLMPALLYWIRPGLFCPLWTLAGLIGGTLLFRRGRRALALLLLSCWVADVLVVAVYRRVDPTLGDLQRYFVLGGTVPVLLTGYSVGRVEERSRLAALGLAALALVCAVVVLPQAQLPISPLAAMRHAQEGWLREHIRVVPPAALLLSESPDFVWAVTGRAAQPARQLVDPESRRRLEGLRLPLILFRESPVPVGGEAAGYLSSTSLPRADPARPLDVVPLAEADLLGQRIGLYRLR